MKLVSCALKQRGGMAERMRIQQMEPSKGRRPVECTYAPAEEQHFCPCYSSFGTAVPRSTG